jgi:hypothetical protein
MLPKRSYANSIQNTQTPGDEQAVIGEYLPQLTYRADAADFEQNVGCDWANPGVPSLAAGDGTPNQGTFTLEWAATRDAERFPGMTYTLEHRQGDGAWSEVAAGLSEPRHTFPAGSPEAEGSWTYRVKAVNGGSVSGYAGTSDVVLVDRTAPSLEVTCPSAVLLNAPASAVTTASDDAAGLAADPSGTTAIDTSSVGPKTTTKTATDHAGNESTRSCTTQVQYLYGGLQQPVNADGSSIFKLGSTVPLKFRLTGSGEAPVAGAEARVYLAKLTGEVEGSYLEAVSTSAADSGNAFREAETGEYRFNLSTKGLSSGTWRVRVVLDDGTSYTQQISLR